MKHVLRVEHLERRNQREGERNRFGDLERSPRQPIPERLALQMLHDQEVHTVLAPDVVERTDVRVVQGGDRARFALEPLLQIGIGRNMLGQHFDGDGAVQTGVTGPVDLTHAPFTEGRLDLIRTQPGA